MNKTELMKMKCWGCKKLILPEDKYCKFCGKGQGKHASWYYHHWGVIALALFALGPFALYFALRSPIISKTAKWIYAVLFTLYTIYISKFIYSFYLVVKGFLSWF
jgi:hypothetical protein